MTAPVEVVEAALANWGDEKAQAAFAEVVKRLLDAEQERDEDQGVIRVWRGRCERAEADNATLLAEMKEAHDNYESVSGDVFSRPHPGAALLEELKGLHEENARLTEERDHWQRRAGLTVAEVVRESYREPIAIRVEGIPETMRAVIEQTARDAALEEAARLFAYAMAVPLDSGTVQFRIRALKKTGQGA